MNAPTNTTSKKNNYLFDNILRKIYKSGFVFFIFRAILDELN